MGGIVRAALARANQNRTPDVFRTSLSRSALTSRSRVNVVHCLAAGMSAAAVLVMRLRGTLLQLLTAAVALPGCPPTGDCPDNETGTIELIEPLAPALQAMVDRCRTAGGYDSIECEPMCRELIVRELGGPPEDVYSCYLSDDTNTTTALTARVS